MERAIAVSLVAFDGHPLEAALETIAATGATHVEPAYIQGTMLFTEDDFSDAKAAAMRRAIDAAGLGCMAISGHMDSGVNDAVDRLDRRLGFAAALGARFLITNTARRERRAAFLRTAETVLRTAERLGVAIAFENPGQGDQELLRCGADAAALLGAIASPWAVLNYDIGNALTNSEGAIRPETDLDTALPIARHLHLKDMVLREDRWRYVALGTGSLDYAAIWPKIAPRADLPLCVEVPMRQVRTQHAPAVRAAMTPPLAEIRDVIGMSMINLRHALAASRA